ncbi:methyltransferase domain-containing protein [Amycolatopsis saalfeldensis]|nr:methyltransferase domain-containing protein [Amycolatopsis saalfeldensis]
MSTNALETETLVALLEKADSLPGAPELRARSYDLLDVQPGSTVADVGCGGGRAVAEMTARGGAAIGVDVNEHMITAARRNHPKLEFRQGTACHLPISDASVHGYRADKVFHEIADPVQALGDARRVLIPRGRIVLIGQDWDAVVIDSDDPVLTRTLVQARADTVPSPRAARAYRSLLLDAGFLDVAVEAHTAVFTDAAMFPMLTGIAHAARTTGAVAEHAAEDWLSEQEQRATTGRLFIALPLFVAAARTPLARYP